MSNLDYRFNHENTEQGLKYYTNKVLEIVEEHKIQHGTNLTKDEIANILKAMVKNIGEPRDLKSIPRTYAKCHRELMEQLKMKKMSKIEDLLTEMTV